MKKILIVFSACLVIFASCKKVTDNVVSESTPANPTSMGRKCASMEVLEQQLINDPSLAARMQAIEDFTQRFQTEGRLSGDTMYIPVVVNVIWNKTAENISNEQIQSQITVLNEDYTGVNADASSIPTLFSTVKAGDTKIRFVLDKINRKQSSKTSWSTSDAVKKTKQGGLDPTSPTTKLNIWTCNLGQNLLGYAQFPGGSAATDGVVILFSAFGSRIKCPTGTYAPSYDLGRTATHEVGHWLNLRHIWGDATCGSDLVDDTPIHNGANYGCPAYPTKSTCSGTPVMMTMNYMDYTNDACMYMFSAGQRTRMQATWAIGGPRASFR